MCALTNSLLWCQRESILHFNSVPYDSNLKTQTHWRQAQSQEGYGNYSNILMQFHGLKSFCSTQMYTRTTSPFLHPSTLHSELFCGNTPTEGVTWTAPLQSVFRSQCAPCFSPLAATEQLCWPSGCGGKGCSWCQMPQCFRVLLIKPFLSASESQSGERETKLRENWTPDLNCHPSSSKHWTQSSLTPTFTQRRHITQVGLSSEPCVCSLGWHRGFLMPLWCESSG